MILLRQRPLHRKRRTRSLSLCTTVPKPGQPARPGEGKNADYNYTFQITLRTKSNGKADFSIKPAQYPANFLFEYNDDGALRGLEFNVWSFDSGNGKNLTEDTHAYATYKMRNEYKYTFENADGTVIYEGMAWEGTNLSLTSPDKNGAVVYYDEEPVGGNFVKYDNGDGKDHWMAADDYEKIKNPGKNNPVVVPIGWYYDRWQPQNNASISGINLNNTVFTAQLLQADGTIKFIDKDDPDTQITAATLLDETRYTKVPANVYKEVVSSKVDGVDVGTKWELLNHFDEIAMKSQGQYASGQEAARAEGQEAAYLAELATYNDVSDNLHAEFYMAWDGEFIYFLAIVDDPTVVTHGRKYAESFTNPYENDCVELWDGSNRDFSKISIDACGYNVFSNAAAGEKGSAYLPYVRQERLAKAEIIGVATPDTQEPMFRAGATGYKVAFAFPAYNEPDKDINNINDKTQWGAKLNRGDTFSFSLQLNNISDHASMATVDAAIATQTAQNADDRKNIYQMAESMEADAIDRINRICFGYQMKQGAQAHIYRYVLE